MCVAVEDIYAMCLQSRAAASSDSNSLIAQREQPIDTLGSLSAKDSHRIRGTAISLAGIAHSQDSAASTHFNRLKKGQGCQHGRGTSVVGIVQHCGTANCIKHQQPSGQGTDVF
jgi:hypothetical protein